MYPVFVDPSVTYYIWETYGFDDDYGDYITYNAITDTGLYSTEAAAQSAVSNPAIHKLGRITEYSGTVNGKIIYKLYDFFGIYGQYKTLRASQIGSVTLFIDADAGDETTVTVHPMTSTWLADVVGENPTAIYNSTLWNAYDSSYGTTYTLDEGGGFQGVDITSIVKSWARFNTGEEGAAYNPANGFVLSSNATESYREVYSSEFGSTNNVYVMMDTGMVGGTYYINNTVSGRFLKAADSYNVETSLYEPTDNIKWHIEYIGNGQYYIRSAANLNSALCSTGGSMLCMPGYEEIFFWNIIIGSNGGVLFKNVYSGTVITCSNTSVDLNSELAPTHANYVQTVWGLIFILPLSGSEIVYDPDSWNGNVAITDMLNCYSYAINNQTYPNTNYLWELQPGLAAGYTFPKETITLDLITTYVEYDAQVLEFTFEPIGKYETCPSGTYKVALVIDPGTDYHWYRQNADGTWSHKPGGNEVVNIDSAGNLIFDPEEAARTYWYADYTVFGGFFKVTPLNNMFVDEGGFFSGYSIRENANYDLIDFCTDKDILLGNDDVSLILPGMTYDEVTQLIGLPRERLTFGVIVVGYQLDNGAIFALEYIRTPSGQLVVESYSII